MQLPSLRKLSAFLTLTLTLTLLPLPGPTAHAQKIAKTSINLFAPERVGEGEELPVTIIVFNGGPAKATDVSISLPIPTGVTFQEGTVPLCRKVAQSLICEIPSLEKNTTRIISIEFTAARRSTLPTTRCPRTAEFQARLSTAEGDTDPKDNLSPKVRTTIECQRRPSASSDNVELSLTLFGPTAASIGERITYTAIASNSSRSKRAMQAYVIFPSPSGLLFNREKSSPFCSDLGSDILCTNFNLEGSIPKAITLIFDVPGNALCPWSFDVQGSLRSATTGNTERRSSTVRTSISCSPSPLSSIHTAPSASTPTTNSSTPPTSNRIGTVDLSLMKNGLAFVTEGRFIRYQLVIGNAGPATATNVVIKEPIPLGLTFVPVSSNRHCHKEGNTVVCQESRVRPGDLRVSSIAFSVNDNATCDGIVFTSPTSVSADQTDSNHANNTAAFDSTVKSLCIAAREGETNPSTSLRTGEAKESQPSPSAVAQPSLELRPAGKEFEESNEQQLTSNYSLLPTTHYSLLTAPSLFIEKTSDCTEAMPGKVITYTTTIYNLSNEPAQSLLVEDAFDPHLLGILAAPSGTVDDGKVVWFIPSLSPRASHTFTYKAIVNTPLPSNTTFVTNTVSVFDGSPIVTTASYSLPAVVLKNPPTASKLEQSQWDLPPSGINHPLAPRSSTKSEVGSLPPRLPQTGADLPLAHFSAILGIFISQILSLVGVRS